MRYFDEEILANSRAHREWWNGEVTVNREHFYGVEEHFASLHNSSAVLPRDAWMELDTITTRVLRDDAGETFMRELLPLARTVNIGKLVVMSRVAIDAKNTVVRSMSGQVPIPMDNGSYDFRGVPVPIFATGYGREWREWNTMLSENFDALADDQEAASYKLADDQDDYVLFGDSNIVFQGYQATGIMNSPYSKVINLGSAAGGANIDLTTADADALDTFFSQTFGAMLDGNKVKKSVSLYISPEIARNWDKSYSGAGGFKAGTILSYLLTNRRIKSVTVSLKLKGNQFFGFVPESQYIRPIIGMAANTQARARLNPTDNYQFGIMAAMGIEVRASGDGHSGVFHSVDQD